jgi:TfoX/Sxy family transcriptional regulator of competence genes
LQILILQSTKGDYMAYDELLAARIRGAIGEKPGLVEKKMFGGVGFLINGNMACGVHKQSLMVRVGPEQHQESLAQPGVRPFDLTGKPMAGWVLVEPEGFATQADLQRWVELGVIFAASLPPK